MKVREATIDDFDIIQQLNAELFKHDFRYDSSLDLNYPYDFMGIAYYKRAIKNRNYLALVCENEKGKVVGYIIGYIKGYADYRKDAVVASLDNIFVIPSYRRKGVATLLVGHLKKWVKSMGANFFRVSAYSKNTGAIKFYERMGFKNMDTVLEQKIKGD